MGLPDIDLPCLKTIGFKRRRCEVSGLWFWSGDAQRTTCGDTHLDEYTFIGEPLISGFDQRGSELKDVMRERFLSFFEQREHTRIAPYPILARWRDDIYLTIASIADFQPHVTSGLVDPPANPLTISQPCIRLTDVDAVGRSGRHLTTFEMMAHHVFNKPDEGVEHYWIDECVELCHELLTEQFGIAAVSVTYVENPWAGGGNAGPAVEVIVGGLELATLVFMNLEEHPDGEFEVKGQRYRQMALQIIDTGYGLERFCWAAAGTPTIYEAIYPESVTLLKRLSGFDEHMENLEIADLDRILGELSRLSGILNIEIGTDESVLQDRLVERLLERGIEVSLPTLRSIMDPLASIYAIPDHLHALTNMLGDGLVPSNVKEGYLARMLARRVLRMRDDLGIDISLADLGAYHLDHDHDITGMTQTREGVLTILELEEQRYAETLRRGEQLVTQSLSGLDKGVDSLPDEVYHRLNDSHGLPPSLVVQIAHRKGWEQIVLRTGFMAELAQRHADQAKLAARRSDTKRFSGLGGLAPTTKLYYQDAWLREFDAEVLASIELDAGLHGIVLDHTAFYPEGGGQEADHGLLTSDGVSAAVSDCHIQGEVIIHICDQTLEVGTTVKGEVNDERRRQLMDHHTAVHIVGGAAREVLGPHVFQAGSNVSESIGRLDITHYHRLTHADLDRIETIANEVLVTVPRTQKMELNRKQADAEFGFDLYQGGAPKTPDVRILRIGDHDTQACGGTHHDEPALIGQIRIIRSTLVQDGVERLHIVAGEAALEHARRQEALLRASCEVFGVNAEDLPRTAERFFEQWKAQKKRVEALEAEVVRLRTSGGDEESLSVDGVRIVIMEVEGDLPDMQKMVAELTRDGTKPTLAIIGSRADGGKLLVALTEDTIASQRYDAAEILNSIAVHIGGGGGGRPTFAQGGGTNPDGLDAALDAAREQFS